ncbi:MAG: hypothetical protein IT306_16155 [Chloroflexi bacterium]|nr:hypothetical protein [Chloroflexota bacterium]
MDEHERMVFFEVWDTEVHLMIDDFDALEMALEAAREMVAIDPHKYPAYLAIAQVNEDETTTWLAKGDSLAALLEVQRPTSSE